MSKAKNGTVNAVTSKTAGAARPTSKLGQLQAMLQRPEGPRFAQLSKALDRQAHSVRGAMSGSLKKQGLKITASKEEGAVRRRLDCAGPQS